MFDMTVCDFLNRMGSYGAVVLVKYVDGSFGLNHYVIIFNLLLDEDFNWV